MKGILMKPWKIVYIAEHPDIEIQTRRVEKGLQKVNLEPDKYTARFVWDFSECIFYMKFNIGNAFDIRVKPRYQQGETVYIKEAWAYKFHSALLPKNQRVIYKAMESDLRHQGEIMPDYWRSPMMMPEWAARYFITITDVRAERLQEIWEVADYLAEGLALDKLIEHYYCQRNDCSCSESARGEMIEKFKVLWNSINKDYPWESNCWVWVYTLRQKLPG